MNLYISDTVLKVSRLCTVSLLLYLMVLKTISPGHGVKESLMLFYLYFVLGGYVFAVGGVMLLVLGLF